MVSCMHSRHEVLSPRAEGMKMSNSNCGYADYGFYVGARNHGVVAEDDFDYEVCSIDYYSKILSSTIPSNYEDEYEIRWSKWSNRSSSKKMAITLAANSSIRTIYLCDERYPSERDTRARPAKTAISVSPGDSVWIGVKNSDSHRFRVRQGMSEGDVNFSAQPRKGYSQIVLRHNKRLHLIPIALRV